MSRFLSLTLPRWPIQHWIAQRAEHDRGTALVLYSDRGQRGLRVEACCQLASRLGVRMGMPLTEATSLAGRGCQVEVEPYAPDDDLDALRQLALHCEPFSPRIGLEEVDPPAGLLLDITGVGKLFGDERELARRLVEHVGEVGYACRVAIADTIGMAWGMARYGKQSIACVTNDAPLDRDQLPVEALRLLPQTASMLRRLGIFRVEQLLSLPRRQLRSRFGEQLLTRLWQWQGELPEMLHPIRESHSFEAKHELKYVVSDRLAIGHYLEPLLAKIGDELQEHRLGAARLECCLRSETGESTTLPVGFCQPTNDPRQMRHLIMLQLENSQLPEGIDSIMVRVIEHAPLETHQSELFSDPTVAEPRELVQLLDKLRLRLGESHVARACLREDYLPERAYEALPRRANAYPAKPPVSDCLAAGNRPLLLHDPPESIHEVELNGRRQPRGFIFRQQRMRVAFCSRRETIETGWWRGATVRRQYYRVRTTSGSSYWLFRDISEDRWFMHGEFL